MSERKLSQEISGEDEDKLFELGLSRSDVDLMTVQMLAADGIVRAKNLGVLHKVPYEDVYRHQDLVEDYAKLNSGDIYPESAARMMRKTHLSSAVLIRTLHIAEEADWLDEMVAPYLDDSPMRFPRLDPPESTKPKIKVDFSLDQIDIRTFIVKSSIGRLKHAQDVRVVRRQVIAGIGNARESDIKDFLGLEARHPNDRRPVPTIVPVSTAFIAHRSS